MPQIRQRLAALEALELARARLDDVGVQRAGERRRAPPCGRASARPRGAPALGAAVAVQVMPGQLFVGVVAQPLERLLDVACRWLAMLRDARGQHRDAFQRDYTTDDAPTFLATDLGGRG